MHITYFYSKIHEMRDSLRCWRGSCTQTSIDTENTHSGTALIQWAARKATACRPTTNGLVASTLEQIGACQSLTSLTQSAASTAVIMPANVRPAGGPQQNANMEWHSGLQQCRYSAVVDNELSV